MSEDYQILEKYPKIYSLLNCCGNFIEIGKRVQPARDEILNLIKQNETLEEKLNDKWWCAACGKWGDHQSGWCPDLLKNDIDIYLTALQEIAKSSKSLYIKQVAEKAINRKNQA